MQAGSPTATPGVQHERLRQVRNRVAQLSDDAKPLASRTYMADSPVLETDGRTPEPITTLKMNVVYGQCAENGHQCRTVGCVAGVTLTMFPEATREALQKESERHNVNSEQTRLMWAARDVLGLDHKTAVKLFLGNSAGPELGNLKVEDVTAAIDRILEGERGDAIWGKTEWQ